MGKRYEASPETLALETRLLEIDTKLCNTLVKMGAVTVALILEKQANLLSDDHRIQNYGKGQRKQLVAVMKKLGFKKEKNAFVCVGPPQVNHRTVPDRILNIELVTIGFGTTVAKKLSKEKYKTLREYLVDNSGWYKWEELGNLGLRHVGRKIIANRLKSLGFLRFAHVLIYFGPPE